MIVTLIVLSLTFGLPAHAEPSTAALAAARLRQEWSPSFKQRATAAKEQIKAAEQYFKGDLELLGAWPELAGVPLLSPGYVQGSLLALDRLDEKRNAERMAPAPDGLTPPLVTRYLKERAAAIDAEEDADQLKRRLLVGLSAGLKAAPSLSQADIDSQIASWRASVPALPEPSDPRYAEVAEQARLVGELESILRRYEQAAVLTMTVPGDLSLVRLSSADLARQTGEQDPLSEAAAVDRLRRVVPLLPPENAERVTAFVEQHEVGQLDAEVARLQAKADAAAAALEAVQPPPEDADREALAAEAAAAREVLAAVQARTAPLLAEAAPEGDPIASRKQEIARLELAAAQRAADLAAERYRLMPEEVLPTAEEAAQQTKDQVSEAQLKAAAAREKAMAANKQELNDRIEKLQGLLDGELSAGGSGCKAGFDKLSEAQQSQHAAVSEAFGDPPLTRQKKLQEVYDAQLTLLRQVRSRITVCRGGVQKVVASNADVRKRYPNDAELIDAAEVDGELGTDLLATLEELVASVERALVSRRQQAVVEQDEAVRLLRDVRADIRVLREALPVSARVAIEQRNNDDLFSGPVGEAADLGPLLLEQAHRMQATESWTLTGIVRRIILFLEGSFGLIIILLAWNLARRQGAAWIERGLRLAQQIVPRTQGPLRVLQETDLMGLSARLVPVVQPAAGVLAGWLMFLLLNGPSPLLGLLALVWVGRAALQLVRPLVMLMLIDEADGNFWIHASADIRELVATSVRQVLRWWVATALLHQLFYAVLRTDLIADRIESVMLFVLAILVVRELLRWSGAISEAVKEAGSDSRFVRWLTSTDGGVVARLLRASAGLAFLTTTLTQRVTTFFIEGRGRMGWVGSLIAQHSLKEIHKDCPPLTDDEQAHLIAQHETLFLHQGEVGEIVAHYAAWCETHRRGMLALIGDRGAGKSFLLRALIDEEAFARHPVLSLSLSGVLEDEVEARQWLHEQLDIPGDGDALPTWRQLREALLARPPQVIVVDDTHRLMLRAVGGFAGLRETLTLMHATSEHHFWITAFHGPAWGFLEGSAVPINLDVFRACVRIAPLEPARVNQWLHAVTEAAGMRFRFDNLAPNLLPNTVEASRELSRIAAAFWRRIADVSAGNPEVLLQLWRRSLRHPPVAPEPVEGDGEAPPPPMLEIALTEPLDVTAIEALPDGDLFVLTAIVIHDGLGVADMARSLNASRGQVRASCRHLEAIGVIERHTDSLFRVCTGWRPAVNRLLRQRHFLHQR